MEFILGMELILVSTLLIKTFCILANGNFNSERIYIGGTDQDLEGSWTWLDNTPWGYSNWQGDEPNGGPEENCLEMVGYSEDDKTAGWWNDIPCGRNETRSFVCAYDNGKEG